MCPPCFGFSSNLWPGALRFCAISQDSCNRTLHLGPETPGTNSLPLCWDKWVSKAACGPRALGRSLSCLFQLLTAPGSPELAAASFQPLPQPRKALPALYVSVIFFPQSPRFCLLQDPEPTLIWDARR